MTDFHEDLLEGAGEIAAFLFGKDGPAERKRVYYLTRRSKLPIFKLGSLTCARKSTLLDHVKEQEARSLEGGGHD